MVLVTDKKILRYWLMISFEQLRRKTTVGKQFMLRRVFRRGHKVLFVRWRARAQRTENNHDP